MCRAGSIPAQGTTTNKRLPIEPQEEFRFIKRGDGILRPLQEAISKIGFLFKIATGPNLKMQAYRCMSRI